VTALYAIGGVISVVMWVGLIHAMVVEPLRGHIHRTRSRLISVPPRGVILNRQPAGHGALGYPTRRLAREH
jgi:hypothetical protein